MRTATELNKRGKPMVTSLDHFMSKNLGILISTCIYLLLVIIGLEFNYILKKSPLVYYVGYVSGLICSIISGIFSALTAGLIFGQIDFVKDIFCLYKQLRYHIVTSLLLLSVPILRIIVATINRSVHSYFKKKLIYILLLILTISELLYLLNMFFYIINHNSIIPYQEGIEYTFSFIIIFISYTAVIRLNNNTR